MRLTSISIALGQSLTFISKRLNLGSGGTWPGEIALKLNPDFLLEFSKEIGNNVILIAGTNGKTTTSLLINSVLSAAGFKIIHNTSGANLENGIASAFINNYALFKKSAGKVFAVFEIDENSLPVVLKQLTPKYVICLNLFRDQLDRYGEVDVIAEKWQKAFKKLPPASCVILNADDPQIAFLANGLRAKVKFFGLNLNKSMKVPEHATDSIFCLNCGSRLFYKGFYYSHLGLWECTNCGLKRPDPEYSREISVLPGLYNLYNSLAAFSLASELKINRQLIHQVFSGFKPAFGRQEELNLYGKKIKIILSKNPASFNQSLMTIKDLKADNILVLLNDRIPDGRDVSWIWDVDFENIKNIKNIILSGDRVYDLAIRFKYADAVFKPIENLKNALNEALLYTEKNNTLYILANYSAMLEVRKLITGKKIL